MKWAIQSEDFAGAVAEMALSVFSSVFGIFSIVCRGSLHNMCAYFIHNWRDLKRAKAPDIKTSSQTATNDQKWIQFGGVVSLLSLSNFAENLFVPINEIKTSKQFLEDF